MMAQPEGFFTDMRPRDYDGQFDWRPAASGGRLVPSPQPRTETVENLEARVGTDFLYVLNDNDGDGFRLARAVKAGDMRWFSVDLQQSGTRAYRHPAAAQRGHEDGRPRIQVPHRYTALVASDHPFGLLLDPSHFESGVAARAYALLSGVPGAGSRGSSARCPGTRATRRALARTSRRGSSAWVDLLGRRAGEWRRVLHAPGNPGSAPQADRVHPGVPGRPRG